MSNSNREAVVKPRSGYSRETSGKFFSSRSALQIGSVHGINARDTRQSVFALGKSKKCASLESDLQDRRGKMFKVLD